MLVLADALSRFLALYLENRLTSAVTSRSKEKTTLSKK